MLTFAEVPYFYYPGASIAIFDTDVSSLVVNWCKEVQSHIQKEVGFDNAIHTVVSDLDRLLSLRRIKVDVITPFFGLSFPKEVDEIRLTENLSLVRVDNELFVQLTSSDVNNLILQPVSPLGLETMIRLQTEVEVRFEKDHGLPIPIGPLELAELTDQNVLTALHVLEKGRVAPVGTLLREPLHNPRQSENCCINFHCAKSSLNFALF